MKFIDLNQVDRFTPDTPHRELLYDSPNLRVLTFNFEPGQELPVHSHSTRLGRRPHRSGRGRRVYRRA